MVYPKRQEKANPMGKIIPDIKYFKFLVNLSIKFSHFIEWILKKANTFGMIQSNVCH